MKPSENCHAATSQPASTVPALRAPVAAQQQEQRQRYAAARDHVQVTVLLEPPRRVGERRARPRARRPGRRRARARAATRRRSQRVGEQEEQVVADDRRVRARARSVPAGA